MKLKQLIVIPSINDDVFYLYLLDILKQNDFKLEAIYHTLSDLSGDVIIEVLKNIDPIIFVGD